MNRKSSRFLGTSVVAAVLALAACSSDWTVRSGVDGGAPSDASTADVAPSGDAASSSDAAPASDAGSCAALLADVASKKTAAITCTLGDVSNCATSVADECGCTVFVGVTGSSAANDYAAAATTAKSAGCTAQCTGCPAVPTRGTCIESGSSFMCSPP